MESQAKWGPCKRNHWGNYGGKKFTKIYQNYQNLFLGVLQANRRLRMLDRRQPWPAPPVLRRRAEVMGNQVKRVLQAHPEILEVEVKFFFRKKFKWISFWNRIYDAKFTNLIHKIFFINSWFLNSRFVFAKKRKKSQKNSGEWKNSEWKNSAEKFRRKNSGEKSHKKIQKFISPWICTRHFYFVKIFDFLIIF